MAISNSLAALYGQLTELNPTQDFNSVVNRALDIQRAGLAQLAPILPAIGDALRFYGLPNVSQATPENAPFLFATDYSAFPSIDRNAFANDGNPNYVPDIQFNSIPIGGLQYSPLFASGPNTAPVFPLTGLITGGRDPLTGNALAHAPGFTAPTSIQDPSLIKFDPRFGFLSAPGALNPAAEFPDRGGDIFGGLAFGALSAGFGALAGPSLLDSVSSLISGSGVTTPSGTAVADAVVGGVEGVGGGTTTAPFSSAPAGVTFSDTVGNIPILDAAGNAVVPSFPPITPAATTASGFTALSPEALSAFNNRANIFAGLPTVGGGAAVAAGGGVATDTGASLLSALKDIPLEKALQIGGPLLASAIQAGVAGSAAGKQADAARQAAQAQVSAQNAAIAEQRRQFDTIQANQAPFRQAGVDALSSLRYGLGLGGDPKGTGLTPGQFLQPLPGYRPFTAAEFQSDPGFQFRLQQGNEAISNNAAARGMLLSPNTIKELEQYASGLAAQDFEAAFRRDLAGQEETFNRANIDRTRQFNELAATAGVGQAATNVLTQAGLATGQGVGANLVAGGNASAGGITGAANASTAGRVAQTNLLAGGVSSALNAAVNQRALSEVFGTGGNTFDPTGFFGLSTDLAGTGFRPSSFNLDLNLAS